MLRRPALLASLAVALIGGCAASRSDRNPPPLTLNPIAEKPTLAIAEAVQQHNLNAQKVDRMQSAAAVSTTSRLLSVAGSGILEFERPRNFRFQVEAALRKQMDIGSNDSEFWFWGNDRKSSTSNIYKCHYDTLAESAEQPPFQPEWIIESLGLYEITESEMRQIRISKNFRPGVDLWEHTRTFGRATTKKITLVDQQTGRFLEHRFFNPSIATPLAVVVPSDFRELRLADGSTVILPQKLHLKIQADEPKQAAELDLILSGTAINKAISEQQRVERFEPKPTEIMPNAKVYYLDDPGIARARGEKPQKRQSLAQPPLGSDSRTGGGVPAQLGEPSPFDRADDSSLRMSDPMPRDQGELSRLPQDNSGVVGPIMPRPPETRIPQIAGQPFGAD